MSNSTSPNVVKRKVTGRAQASPTSESALAPELTGAPVEETSPLGYNVGFTSAIFLNMSTMIGMGVYSTPSSVLRSVGSVGLCLIFWMIGPLIAFAGLALYTELASICGPLRSGAEVVYLEQAYPKPPFLFPTTFGFTNVLLSSSGINAIVFAQHTLDALDVEITPWRQRGLAVGMVTMAVLSLHFSVCLASTRWSLRIVNVTTTLKIITLVLCVIASTLCFKTISMTGLVVLLGLTSRPDPYANFRHVFEGSSFNGNALATALVKVNYSFTGWSSALNVLAEVRSRDPIRTTRNAGYTAVASVSLLYLTAVAAFMVVLPKEKIQNSGQLVGALFVKELFGYNAGSKIFPVFVAISCFGGTVASTISQTRVLREVGRQGVLPFPEFWSSVRPFGTPLGPILLKYTLSVIVIVTPPAEDAFNFLLDLASYPGLVFAIATSIAVWVLRRRQIRLGIAPSPYQTWNIVVWVYLIKSVFLFVMPWIPPEGGSDKGDVSFFYALYCIVGIGLLAACGVYYYIWIVLLPKWQGYQITEEIVTLPDGAKTKQLKRVYLDATRSSAINESTPLLNEG